MSAAAGSAAGEERERLTYGRFGEAVRELAQAVADDGYVPDVVLSIARGGVFVAGGLAHALDCKNLHLVNVEFCTGVGTTLEMPVMLAPVPNVTDFSAKRVLIADDVADTGRTLELVHDFCCGHVAEVRSAVVYEKAQSLVKCEYVWKRTARWVDFPWSVEPPVVRRDGGGDGRGEGCRGNRRDGRGGPRDRAGRGAFAVRAAAAAAAAHGARRGAHAGGGSPPPGRGRRRPVRVRRA